MIFKLDVTIQTKQISNENQKSSSLENLHHTLRIFVPAQLQPNEMLVWPHNWYLVFLFSPAYMHINYYLQTWLVLTQLLLVVLSVKLASEFSQCVAEKSLLNFKFSSYS